MGRQALGDERLLGQPEQLRALVDGDLGRGLDAGLELDSTRRV
jgi:hypothetical protein